MIKRALTTSLATILAISGCTPPSQPVTPAPPPPTTPPRMAPKMLVQRTHSVSASDAPLQLQVDLYQLHVPYGTISQNSAFWKRVDEDIIGVKTYDLLFKNGVRVGQAPVSEWDHFRQVMEEFPTVTKSNKVVGAEGRPIELPMRKEVPGQDIWYFDQTNQLKGRTYGQCENVVMMTIQSAPRKEDTLRLVLCPVVRGMRKRLEYSAMNNELGEVSYAAPEHLYDVNLRVDVPVDHFLIVAPSGEATWPTSIGNSFFVAQGAAEKMETVLLIVPKPLRLVETPVKR